MRISSTQCNSSRALRWAVGTIALSFLYIGSAMARNCWVQAGERYGIDPLLLLAIAQVESSLNPRALNHNRNGSCDIGLMQINSAHLPRLIKVGVTRERLIEEPCTSVNTGASILAGFIDQFGYTWNAVGAYNAGATLARAPQRKIYAHKVWREYQRLTRNRRANLARLSQEGR